MPLHLYDIQVVPSKDIHRFLFYFHHKFDLISHYHIRLVEAVMRLWVDYADEYYGFVSPNVGGNDGGAHNRSVNTMFLLISY